MRIRTLTPFALALTVACGGADTDVAAEDDTPQGQEYAAANAATAAASNPEAEAAARAAVNQIVGDWARHYNMGAGHAAMAVAGLADDGLLWTGDGTMHFSKADIIAAMEAELEMGEAQISITPDRSIVMGENFVVTRGQYEVNGEMEGQAFTNSGYWTSLAENIEGTWTLHGVVANVGGGDQMVPPAAEASMMPENGQGAELLQERLDYYMTHFNAGHPDMVAALYTENAVVMGSGQEATTGRPAALARLTEMVESGTKITDIDIWSAGEYEQYITGIGTYTLTNAAGEVNGHFAALYRKADDGTPMLHWLLTSNHPTAM